MNPWSLIAGAMAEAIVAPRGYTLPEQNHYCPYCHRKNPTGKEFCSVEHCRKYRAARKAARQEEQRWKQ